MRITAYLRLLRDDVATGIHGLHVEGDEVVVTLGQGLVKRFLQTVVGDNGTDAEQTAQDNHVEDLRVFHLCRLVHRIDSIDIDVGALGRIDDAVVVVDEDAAGLHTRLELIERGLVEHDGDIVLTEDRRRDALIRDDDRDVGGAATLFGTVGRHPCHLFVFHQGRVSENLTH